MTPEDTCPKCGALLNCNTYGSIDGLTGRDTCVWFVTCPQGHYASQGEMFINVEATQEQA